MTEKKNKDEEFWSSGPEGGKKISYSFLESRKKNYPLWKKILIVIAILLGLSSSTLSTRVAEALYQNV